MAGEAGQVKKGSEPFFKHFIQIQLFDLYSANFLHSQSLIARIDLASWSLH